MTEENNDMNGIDFLENKYVFKASVPIKDGELLKDWNDNCTSDSPIGFNDYRWGKMLHDHMFAKQYKIILTTLIDQINNLSSKIEELESHILALKKEDVKKENSDLLK